MQQDLINLKDQSKRSGTDGAGKGVVVVVVVVT
jgi:hypothetical protein